MKTKRHTLIRGLLTGLSGTILLLLTSTGCQLSFPLPVCQKCLTNTQCTADETCYTGSGVCVPKGMCYCPADNNGDTCTSPLCAQTQTCQHPKGQPFGTCGEPPTCQSDRDCNKLATCNEGRCQFRFFCSLPAQCNEGEVRACTAPGDTCTDGEQTCRFGVWQTCQPRLTNDPETCDGKDNDCDGKIDNGTTCVSVLKDQLGAPRSLIRGPNGNLIFSDTRNHAIYSLTPDGKLSILAGQAQQAGSNDGPGDKATFNSPHGLTIDSQGNIYVADTDNSAIRKLTPATLNGSCQSSTGYCVTTIISSNEGAGLSQPRGIGVAQDGTIYIASTGVHKILKLADGKLTLLAGSGIAGLRDGNGANAQFNAPRALLVATDGNIYVADTNNHAIRRISPAGLTSTLAGGTAGDLDGFPPRAQFRQPSGLSLTPQNTLLVADTDNHKIRTLSLSGEVKSLAGNSSPGYADGDAPNAQLRFPWGVVSFSQTVSYVADTDNGMIRIITETPK